jgi:uridine kinase
VIAAIASGVGGGKSTLVASLAAELGDAASTVHFDHYERVTEQPVEAVRRWMAAGADPDALTIPGLAEDLEALKSGRMVTDPLTRAHVPARRVVLFETQFGRRHAASGRHIDLLIWIDTPLDVALARKLRQLAGAAAAQGAREAAAFAAWLPAYLDNYLGLVEKLLRSQRETVRPQADLILDGRKDPARLRLEAAQAIRDRLG